MRLQSSMWIKKIQGTRVVLWVAIAFLGIVGRVCWSKKIQLILNNSEDNIFNCNLQLNNNHFCLSSEQSSRHKMTIDASKLLGHPVDIRTDSPKHKSTHSSPDVPHTIIVFSWLLYLQTWCMCEDNILSEPRPCLSWPIKILDISNVFFSELFWDLIISKKKNSISTVSFKIENHNKVGRCEKTY